MMSSRLLAAASVVLLINVLVKDVFSLRAPVREYAGLISKHQAVLIDPSKMSTSLHPIIPKSVDDEADEDNDNDKDDVDYADDVTESSIAENLPTPASLVGFPPMFMSHLFKRISNTTNLRRRFRKTLPGRRAQAWRQRIGGLAPVSASGLSRLRGGVSLSSLNKLGGLSSLQSMSSDTQKHITRENILQFIRSNSTRTTTTTVQPTTDFLSQWHNTYSQGQSDKPTNASQSKKPSGELFTKSNKHNVRQTSTRPTNNKDIGQIADSLSKGIDKNSRPESSPFPSTGIPSVHDMTSLHFSNSSTKHPIKKNQKNSQTHNRREARPKPKNTTTPPSPTTMKPPNFTKKPTKTSVHDREILESIKTIVRSSAQSTEDYSSLKYFNGNQSPGPLDIFSDVKPAHGFKPSYSYTNDDIKSANATATYEPHSTRFMESEASNMRNIYNQPIVTNAMSNAPDPQPESFDWKTSFNPQIWSNRGSSVASVEAENLDLKNVFNQQVRSNIGPNAANAGPSIIITAPPPGHDITLQVGHSLPVASDRHSEVGEVEVRTINDNEIVIGRPAALIQAPTTVTTGSVSKMPPTLRNTEGTPILFRDDPYIITTQEPALNSPFPYWHPPELQPIVEMIKKKYEDNNHEIPYNAYNSALKLKSMIERGEVPEYFKKEHIIDYIHQNPTRFETPNNVDRMGEPFRSTMTSLMDNENAEKGITGQFVALSGLALLMAFGGYYLFSSTPGKESRGVEDPLLNAVGQARHGLQLLQQGLDEYETKLIEKKENLEEGALPHNKFGAGVNIPHLDIITNNFKIIWKTIQEMPSKIANDMALNEVSPFSNAIKLFSKNFQHPEGFIGAVKDLVFNKLIISTPSSREPHKLDLNSHSTSNDSQRNVSENYSFLDLFKTSSVSKNIVLNIMSQLQLSPLLSGYDGENQEYDRTSRIEPKENSDNRIQVKSSNLREDNNVQSFEGEITKPNDIGSMQMNFLDDIIKAFIKDSNKRQGHISLLQQMAADFHNKNPNHKSSFYNGSIVDGNPESSYEKTEIIDSVNNDQQLVTEGPFQGDVDATEIPYDNYEATDGTNLEKTVTEPGELMESTESPVSLDMDPSGNSTEQTESTTIYEGLVSVDNTIENDDITTTLPETTTLNIDYADVSETETTTQQDGLMVTPQLVFINNKLHARHNPDTEPPRNGAYLRNRPFKRLR